MKCSAECGGGNQTVEKYCDNPKPEYGGTACKCNEHNSDETFCDGKLAVVEKSCNTCTCPGPCGN